ncbi:type II secretion system F family protein [Nocardioides jishulii]|uniref:Type II secretion system F family protein n=1 Tax=Nocardioides jishulii TaxID=2575440 RepID=A0A4U2YM00_9ACTN|nr:type II secretion system F family protein [Nocardioides jishulii]QCX27141.1 type II secretion system F family protein [Nocardioides jishulii]TKI61625.1 type II secretion system F family protein [Nocardioides jishulii]
MRRLLTVGGATAVVAGVVLSAASGAYAAEGLPSAPDGLFLAEWGKYVAMGLVALAVLLLVVGLFLKPKRAELTLEERVTLYASGGGAAEGAGAHAAPTTDQLAQFKGAAESVLKRNTSLEARIGARLDAAGSGFKAPEWLLLHIGVVIVAGMVGLFVGGGNIIVGILFLVLGIIGPWFYLGFLKKRRAKKFNSLLPDTLQLMSGSLSAGLSLAQSIDTIVREGSEPIAGEFKRVLVETRLGVPLEDAMEGITERFDSKDFAWIVMAIKIQRQVGGNLGELLDTVAGTIREREYMRRQVDALAAEGKISAYVLGGLPPLFGLYLFLTQPGYINPMFESPLGWAMLGGAVLMLAVGAFWMSRLIKVEV